MQFRSWMLVPGDHEKKLSMAAAVGADVVVLDLEAPSSREAKQDAREKSVAWLIAHRQRPIGMKPMGRWVRINPLESRMWRDDLVAVMPGAPEGVFVPKCTSPETVREIAAEIYELEPRHGIKPGSTQIMVIVGENAKAAMTMASYIDASLPRFAGISWSTQELTASLGALRHRNSNGNLTDVFRYVRAQTLLTAHACGIMAIERMCGAAPNDAKAATAAAYAARADGFTGMFACHPAQVSAINSAFTPSEQELAGARALLATIESRISGGGLDRRMINRPEVKQAQRLLRTVEPESEPTRVGSLSALRPA